MVDPGARRTARQGRYILVSEPEGQLPSSPPPRTSPCLGDPSLGVSRAAGDRVQHADTLQGSGSKRAACSIVDAASMRNSAGWQRRRRGWRWRAVKLKAGGFCGVQSARRTAECCGEERQGGLDCRNCLVCCATSSAHFLCVVCTFGSSQTGRQCGLAVECVSAIRFS